MKGFRNIVVTGASGGLGAALVAGLSRPDRRILLMGRDQDRLLRVCETANGLGAEAEIAAVPIEDHGAVAARIGQFDRAHPVDLIIAGAGVKCGNAQGVEPEAQLARIIDVNLTGTIMSVQTVLPGMRQRGRGRVAIISSLAALSPQGCLISYSATKAALQGYAVALRRSCRGSGIGVSLIVPGFVDTRMTDRHLGPTPFRMSPQKAAGIVIRGLEAGRATIAFPRMLVGLARLGGLVPAGLADFLAHRLEATILPDDDELAARQIWTAPAGEPEQMA